MDAYSSVAPPDTADRTAMDEAIRALLGALASVHNTKPSVTLVLGEAEWARARTYYQRPYQRKPTSEFGVYLAEGTVWFQRAEPEGVDFCAYDGCQRGRVDGAWCPAHADPTARDVLRRADNQRRKAEIRAIYTAEASDPTVSERRRELAREVLATLEAERDDALLPPEAPGPRLAVVAPPPADAAAVTERALQTGAQVLGSSSSVTSTARESGAVYGGPWVAPEDR